MVSLSFAGLKAHQIGRNLHTLPSYMSRTHPRINHDGNVASKECGIGTQKDKVFLGICLIDPSGAIAWGNPGKWKTKILVCQRYSMLILALPCVLPPFRCTTLRTIRYHAVAMQGSTQW